MSLTHMWNGPIGEDIRSVKWNCGALSHEDEYRLILHSDLQSFDDPASRKIKYRFADLTGIVFGIKTAFADKIRIMRIVEQKCRAEGRTEFEFQQAHYSHRARKLELVPMSLLKLV